MLGDPPIAGVGEPGDPRQHGSRRPATRQQGEGDRQPRPAGDPFSRRRDEMPRRGALLRREVSEDPGGGLGLQADGLEAAVTVPAQQQAKNPDAEAAVGVVEDEPRPGEIGR